MRRRSLLAASAMRAVTEVNAYAYVVEGYEIHTSVDCGQTWDARTWSVSDVVRGLSINVDGEGLVAAEGWIGNLPVVGDNASLWPCTGYPQNLCQSSGSEYIFYSTNAGSGWQTGYSTTIYKKQGLAGTPVAVETFNTWDQASNYMVCSESGKDIILGGKAGFTNCFYSTDYGQTWAETAATQSVGAGCNQVDISNDGKYCMVAMSDGLWFSSRGPAYLAKTGSANIMSCAISGDGNVMYYVASNTLYRSYDHGKTWENLGSCGTPLKMQTTYLGESILTYDRAGLYVKGAFGETGWSQKMSVSSITDIVLNKFRKF